MNSYTQKFTLNLLPPEKLYCDFNFWKSLFNKDMKFPLDKSCCLPLIKLPQDDYDLIFPYFLIALSNYKVLNKKMLPGIGIDNLLNLWVDKYSLNKNGFFQLTKPIREN